MTDRYSSIEEVRAALYPRMARLVQLDPSEHVSLPPVIRWPHWHHHPKRGWYPCTEDHRPGKRMAGAQSEMSTEEEIRHGMG